MVVINPHTTRATGTILTAAIYNADHQNHITNATNLNIALGAIGGVSLVTGLVVNNGAGVFSGRTLQAGVGIDITNPDGVAGDPTILIENNVALPGNASSVGSFTVGTNLTVIGLASLTGGAVLKSTAIPANTGEGTLEWDSDGDFLVAGDGVGQKFIGKRPTSQVIAANGATWNKPVGCRYIKLRGAGGGAGGGGVDGQGAGTGGSGGGGGSGFSGEVFGYIDVSAVVSAVCTIGAGGTAGSAGGGDGGNGGDTSVTIAGVTYTFGGGVGGGGMIAGGTIGGSQDGGAGGIGTNVIGSGSVGGIGVYNGNSGTNSTGGNGASSLFGTGGKGQHLIAGGNLNGLAGTGFGGGGGGGTTNNSVNNATGGVGSQGILLYEEFY